MPTIHSSDRRGKIPAYIQVAAALRRRIETGDWQPSEKIATLEELEEEFQVARVTVRQAVDLLPDRVRQTILRRWRHGLRNAEIATVMGVSVKAVEANVARGVERLRGTLVRFGITGSE